MLDTYKYKGLIHCPVCSKDAPSVGLCPHCGCYTDCRTSPATGQAVASQEHCESDYDKLNKIAALECHCPDDVWGTRCITCIASGALNLSAELLSEAVKEIYSLSPESVGAE